MWEFSYSGKKYRVSLDTQIIRNELFDIYKEFGIGGLNSAAEALRSNYEDWIAHGVAVDITLIEQQIKTLNEYDIVLRQKIARSRRIHLLKKFSLVGVFCLGAIGILFGLFIGINYYASLLNKQIPILSDLRSEYSTIYNEASQIYYVVENKIATNQEDEVDATLSEYELLPVVSSDSSYDDISWWYWTNESEIETLTQATSIVRPLSRNVKLWVLFLELKSRTGYAETLYQESQGKVSWEFSRSLLDSNIKTSQLILTSSTYTTYEVAGRLQVLNSAIEAVESRLQD
jgi:hypothetical protein